MARRGWLSSVRELAGPEVSAKLRGLLLDNLPIKLLALGLAVGLVLTKRQEQAAESIVDLRVQVTYPSDQVLVSTLVRQIKVKIRGPYKAIKELSSSSLPPLEVALFGFEEQQYSFDRAAVKLPPELQVVEFLPSTMIIAFESKKQAVVPIRVKLDGEPAPGFRLVSYQVVPSSVMVSGAASAVEGLKEVWTSPVALDGRSRSVGVSVTLAPPPRFVSYLHGNQEYMATLVFEELRESRLFAEQLIQVRGLAEGSPGFEVSPPTVDVTLEGPVRLLDGLDASTLAPFVDVSGAPPLRRILKSQRVAIEPVAGLVIKALEPTRVTLLRREPPPTDGAVPNLDPEDAGAP